MGCGTSTGHRSAGPINGQPSGTPQQAHPQAVDPVAGNGAGGGASDPPSTVTLAANPGRPSAPATVTGAPASGAPTDAEVRAAYVRFQAAVRRYHLDRLNFSGDLLDPADLPPGQWFTSIASVYTDYGLPVACGGVLHVPELGVANKTLPCGTEVTFIYGGRAIRVPVIDRGPYIAGREWDLTGATAEALNFPGLGSIQWRIG